MQMLCLLLKVCHEGENKSHLKEEWSLEKKKSNVVYSEENFNDNFRPVSYQNATKIL